MYPDAAYRHCTLLYGAAEQQENIADFALPASIGTAINTRGLNSIGSITSIVVQADQLLTTIVGVTLVSETSRNNLSGQAIYNERRVELAFANKCWLALVRTGRAIATITAYGNCVRANPQACYYPAGAVLPNNAFASIKEYYPLPADEAALSLYF